MCVMWCVCRISVYVGSNGECGCIHIFSSNPQEWPRLIHFGQCKLC